MTKYKFLFGPVPSRRLGMSLGIDLVPAKVCSLDCVYCEVGRTTKLTANRAEYVPLNGILEELNDFFIYNEDPDYITFSGSGEPTLNNRIKEVLQYVKSRKPSVPVAVLTNGTLCSDINVRQAIINADVVLPSLDAATDKVFTKINRPVPLLTAAKCIEGLTLFRQEYQGQMWLEVFILPGYNDDPYELAAIKNAILRIQPNKIQLNTLDRPGTVPGLRSATREELIRIIDFWDLPNVEIIASAVLRKQIQSYKEDIESIILGTITRRPCTLKDLSIMLGLHGNEINKYLSTLEQEGKIYSTQEERGIFFRLK
ncbi:MAG: radical SAM protein [Bacteroidales bacterium]|jgi:wyosine [tRNA(Phe)-imidazoG37] synthetase (radical SAM superfamily)|nr:radical SAM protein [Bacteroidales bacterium]MDD4257743.1 radical SAM protein [Bacteroidales bacterium]MDD4500556.1 radical SAM protein [Bacteroidales bacterium]MDD4827148.1 radical SAM protein [Bacteroidales bacterium]